MESLDDIFLNARDLTNPEQRAAYLTEACGTDKALLCRIEEMLRDAEAAEHFFAAKESLHPITGPQLSEQTGNVIGRYKLLQKIGEGGMGLVYMAEQHEPVTRKVALKIIKLGMDTQQVIARFEAERQALALMDHPNIAKVFDGGATESGRPYFVMELVQGLSITEFCDRECLPMAQRLGLFLDVCSAIQHAHQKGIIHRDLKPSNILVTLHGDRPVPKVIDFGIAKATQGRLTEKTVFTQFQQFIGTPAYTSPEQASLSGLDVDTRSDIYALGVLLYELLTGETPFASKDLLDAGFERMREIIREREPQKPSTRLSTLRGDDLNSTARLRHLDSIELIHFVRGDLDWIVMKCLEKDRARRYETANALALDLQRYLQDELVTARPPSRLYRFQKFARRNRIALAGAAGIVLALLTGVVVSTWQAFRATRAEREARAQAEAARAVKDFLVTQLLSPANPTTDPIFDPNKQGMLERMAIALDNKLANPPQDESEFQAGTLRDGLARQPRTEAEIRSALGQGFGWLRDYDRAAAQHERALELRRHSLGLDHPDTLHTAARVAFAYLKLNRLAEAKALLDATIATGQSSPRGPCLGLGVALMVRGLLLERQQRFEEALGSFQQAVPIMKQTAGERYSDVGATLSSIARSTESLGRTDEARRRWAEAVEHNQRVHQLQYPTTVAALTGQAMFLLRQGEVDQGLKILENSLPVQKVIFGANSLDYLSARFRLGRAFEQSGQIEKAAELFAGLNNTMTRFISIEETLDDCAYVGIFFARIGRYAEARGAFESLRAALEKSSPSRAVELAWLLRTIAATHGTSAAAVTCHNYFQAFSNDPILWRSKAVMFALGGDGESYATAASRAIGLTDTATNWEHQIAIAQILALQPLDLTPDETEQCQSLLVKLHSGEGSAQQLQKASCARGILLLRLGRPNEALKPLEECLACEPSPVDRASALFLEAICLAHLGRADDSRDALDKAEVVSKSFLKEPLEKFEPFLDESERICLQLSREAHAARGPSREASQRQ